MKQSKRLAYEQQVADSYSLPTTYVRNLGDGPLMILAKLVHRYNDGRFGMWNLNPGGDILDGKSVHPRTFTGVPGVRRLTFKECLVYAGMYSRESFTSGQLEAVKTHFLDYVTGLQCRRCGGPLEVSPLHPRGRLRMLPWDSITVPPHLYNEECKKCTKEYRDNLAELGRQLKRLAQNQEPKPNPFEYRYVPDVEACRTQDTDIGNSYDLIQQRRMFLGLSPMEPRLLHLDTIQNEDLVSPPGENSKLDIEEE